MRSQEFYLEVALAVLIAFLAFLGLQILEVALQPQETAAFSPQRLKEVTSSLFENPTLQEFFLVAYPDEQLLAFRDVFEVPPELLTTSGPQEMVKYPQENPGQGSQEMQTLQKEPEKQPQVSLKGVVLSQRGQVVLLEVDGQIQFLTFEKPLSSGIKLVKVKEKEVVLEYQGREITLNLAD